MKCDKHLSLVEMFTHLIRKYKRKGEFFMVMVCKDHVTKGLRVLPVPHVKELPENTKRFCSYCDQQAKFKLYLSDRTTHFVILKEERQKRKNEDLLVRMPVGLEA